MTEDYLEMLRELPRLAALAENRGTTVRKELQRWIAEREEQENAERIRLEEDS